MNGKHLTSWIKRYRMNISKTNNQLLYIMKNKIKTIVLLMSLVTTWAIDAQNGPRNNNANFPEAVPTNSKVQLIDQKEEVYKLSYLKDVVYGHTDSVDLKLQIITPEPYQYNGEKFPCIMYIRGSAWMKQNLYTDVPLLAAMAHRGYVVAIVEYRSSDIATFPAQRNDAIAAVNFMRDNADKYMIDTNNLFVWGSSSGAHIALFTGLEMKDKKENAAVPEINGVIAYFPPTDILHLHEDPTAASKGDANSPEGLLLGKVAMWDAPEKAKEASPLYYIKDNPNMPPVFLAHGTKDRVVPFSQSDALANEMEKYGREYEFYALRNADHGSWQFWTKEMLDKVDGFIKKHLKK